MAESKFEDDEIERERRKLVQRAKHLDDDKLELKQALRRIIQSGTQEEFEAKLAEIGKGPQTPEGKALLNWFLSVRRSRSR